MCEVLIPAAQVLCMLETPDLFLILTHSKARKGKYLCQTRKVSHCTVYSSFPNILEGGDSES